MIYLACDYFVARATFLSSKISVHSAQFFILNFYTYTILTKIKTFFIFLQKNSSFSAIFVFLCILLLYFTFMHFCSWMIKNYTFLGDKKSHKSKSAFKISTKYAKID